LNCGRVHIEIVNLGQIWRGKDDELR